MPYERNTQQDWSFLTGLCAGAFMGVGLGLLFAPKSGSQLRGSLADAATRMADAGTDTYRQAREQVSRAVERGREAYGHARESYEGEAGQTTAGTTSETHGSGGGIFGSASGAASNMLGDTHGSGGGVFSGRPSREEGL